MQKKKNGFLHFIFSFIPGAGEMYMGFMKMGLSLVCLFGILVLIVSITYIPELSVFPAILYMYSFFHTHNLRSLDDARFSEVEDAYLFDADRLLELKDTALAKGRKWIAIILIVLGVIILWKTGLQFLWEALGGNNRILGVLSEITDYIPRVLIGIGIIFGGIKLIVGGNTCKEVEE